MPEHTLVFEAQSHSADAIQRAAYKFADRFSIELSRAEANYICQLHLADETDDAVIDDFRTEVLDQVLRERIREETADVRNLVLALAFSNTALSEAPRSSHDTPDSSRS